MKLILLGAPGAGKGTQAEQISKKASIPTISTGNMIRSAIKAGTQMGLQAQEFINIGKFVPDEIVIDIIKERIAQDDCQNGFILDGFPRNIAQANELEKMNIEIDAALEISLPDETIVKRLSGRRVCSECGNSYHLEDKKPKVDGICDACGAKLIQRVDDKPEIILDRLKTYHAQTKPLIDFYDKKGKLRTVVGQKEVADTTALVFSALEDLL